MLSDEEDVTDCHTIDAEVPLIALKFKSFEVDAVFVRLDKDYMENIEMDVLTLEPD
jgi:poly(A) polymerase Pap1